MFSLFSYKQIILSFYDFMILSFYHFMILSFYHFVILSFYDFINLSVHQLIMLSFSKMWRDRACSTAPHRPFGHARLFLIHTELSGDDWGTTRIPLAGEFHRDLQQIHQQCPRARRQPSRHRQGFRTSIGFFVVVVIRLVSARRTEHDTDLQE